MEVPDWLRICVQKWSDIFHLWDWKITLRVEHTIDNDPHTWALCRQRTNVHEADVIFRDDAEDNQGWQETVIHELLHITHAYVDQVVQEVIVKALPGDQQETLNRAYEHVTEQYIDLLAKHLWKLEQEESDGRDRRIEGA